RPVDGRGARTTTRRYRIDMNARSDEGSEERLVDDRPGSLSRIDDRYIGHDYRYGFLAYSDASKPFDAASLGISRLPINSIGRFDFQTGAAEALFAGSSSGLAEVVFAPRSADAAEGDGWVMCVATNYAE